jgi:hypothetical protein
MEADMIRFMSGVVETLRMAGRLVSQIEESGLGLGAVGDMPEHRASALQQVDLLHQSLTELERLSMQAIRAMAADDPVAPLMCDIRLEAVAACFDRPNSAKHAQEGNPLITLFD